MTFSICAFDEAGGELGIAVQSKFLAVGAAVPYARAGVGAVATQASANTSYGPRGLELLAAGASADEAVARLVGEDDGRDHRQLGIVDASGRAASFTGPRCLEWAGHLSSRGFCAQGNLLAGPAVVEGMARAFEDTRGILADRLLAALAAGQRAGGDRRGMESAALLVVKEGGGYGGYNDRFIDLRVDDHERPIGELARLLDLHKLYYRVGPVTLVPIDGALRRELEAMLARSGQRDLETLFGMENLEERWAGEDRIDDAALRYLRSRYPDR